MIYASRAQATNLKYISSYVSSHPGLWMGCWPEPVCSNGVAPWGRERMNGRDIVSWKLILHWQWVLMFSSPSGTADPIRNVFPLCNEFCKSRDTHLILLEDPLTVLLSVNVILMAQSRTRSFIHARLCALLHCGLSRAFLPAPPGRLDP